jgi:hypothetical protein
LWIAGGADWNSELITTVTEAVTDDWTRATASTARQMKRLQRQQQGKRIKKERQIASKGKIAGGLFQFLWKRRSSLSMVQPQHAPERRRGVMRASLSTLDAADKHESLSHSAWWILLDGGYAPLRNNDDTTIPS